MHINDKIHSHLSSNLAKHKNYYSFFLTSNHLMLKIKTSYQFSYIRLLINVHPCSLIFSVTLLIFASCINNNNVKKSFTELIEIEIHI